MNLTNSGISKNYQRNTWGLRDFDPELNPSTTGLLGPNGAVKSTLMRILATITQPTEGTIRWKEAEIAKSPACLRAVLGYLPPEFGVYPNLTAIQLLEYIASVKGWDAKSARIRIEELLVMINLTPLANRPLDGYSGKIKQRVGIAQALLNDPQLLIVDKPTLGLDTEARDHFLSLLSDLSGERIIFLSTHIISDMEAVAVATFRFDTLITAELKLLLKRQRWWWHLIAARLLVAQVLVSLKAVHLLLIVSWVWHLLIISNFGCRETFYNTQQLIFSVLRQLAKQFLASWRSAFIVTALPGLEAWVRFVLAGEMFSLVSWLAGALFIPLLALTLGTLTESSKAIEKIYMLWLYLLAQKVSTFDFIGLTPAKSTGYVRFAIAGPALHGFHLQVHSENQRFAMIE